VAGLVVSLVLGEWLTRKSVDDIREEMKERGNEIDIISDYQYKAFFGLPYFSSRITGTIERLVFTILVAFDAFGLAIALAVWIGVKVTTDWLAFLKDGERNASGCVMGKHDFVSFASLGLICRLGTG
jgi:hypothetical protein